MTTIMKETQRYSLVKNTEIDKKKNDMHIADVRQLYEKHVSHNHIAHIQCEKHKIASHPRCAKNTSLLHTKKREKL